MEDPNTISASRDDDEAGLLDLALILAESLRFLVLIPIVAGAIALVISFFIPATYTATTRILPPAQQQASAAAMAAQLGSLAGLAGGAALKNPADQYVALLSSRTVFDAIIRRFKLNELYDDGSAEGTRRMLAKRTRMAAGSKDGIISIDVEDRDPKRAAEMANAFVEELQNLSKSLAITEAAQRRLFFETQLLQAKNNLTKAEVSLRGSDVSEATLRTIPQSALEALARLKAQITAQEIRLASMRVFMTDSNPAFKLAIQELVALRSELAKAEQGSTVAATTQGAAYIARYRDFKYHETLFELMAKQYELARLDEAREGAIIQIVDTAQPPDRQSRPRKVMITVLTILAALVATVAFTFARHAIRNASKNPVSAEKLERLRRLLRLRPQ
jgi:tyrosine-protein kinase Etk/Wzc